MMGFLRAFCSQTARCSIVVGAGYFAEVRVDCKDRRLSTMRRHHILCAIWVVCAGSIGAIHAVDATDVQFHGFVSQGYLQTTNGNNLYSNTSKDGGTVRFTEAGINVTAKPYDRVTVGVQVAATDFGRYFGMKPQLDWAYGKCELPKMAGWLDGNIAIGRVKLGHALYNDYRDLDMTRTSVFLPQTNYNPAFRDLYLAGNGVQVNLSASAGSLGSFDIAVFAGTTTFDASNGPLYDTFVGSYGRIGPLINDVACDSITVQRIEAVNLTWNTPLEGLRAKASLFAAQDFVAAGTWTAQNALGAGVIGPAYAFTTRIPDYYQAVGSLEYQAGSWTFAAELSHDLYYFSSLSTAVDPGSPLGPSIFQDGYGVIDSGYVSATWQFHPQWSVYASFCSTNYGDENHYEPANMHRGYSAAIRYDATQHILLKAEFERNEGAFLLYAQDNPRGTEKWWNLVAVKATLDF